MELSKVLHDLVEPMVENKNALNVKELSSLNENEIILVIYAQNDDVGRLIGRKGSMANALRQVMGIASRQVDKKVTIKFEAIE